MSDANVIKSAVLLDMPVDARMDPFLENRSTGFLSVKAKPVIQFWCEHLSQLGVANIKVVSRHFPEQMREFLGNGKRWGLSVEVVTVPESFGVMDLLKFIRPGLSGKTFIASLSVLPRQTLVTPDQNLFEEVPMTRGSLETGFAAGCLLDDQLVTDFLAEQSVTFLCARDTFACPLTTPRELWQANMDALHDRLDDPLPAGFEGEKGMVTDIGVQIRPGFKLVAPVSLGRNSMLAQKVFVGPGVVIGNDCMIDRQNRLRESVVLDNTYIGSHSDLRRVIVDGSLVYQVDDDHATWIDDPAILGSTQAKRSVVGISERLLAVALLLVIIPIVLLHAVVSMLSGNKPFDRERLFMPSGRDLTGQISYRVIDVLSLNLSHPLWRKLPWFAQVMDGKMHMVGISPLRDDKVDYPLWAKGLIGIRPGVVNLSDIEVDIGVENEQFIHDNYFVVTKSYKNSIMLFGRWIRRLFVFDTSIKK